MSGIYKILFELPCSVWRKEQVNSERKTKYKKLNRLT
jgi:hypothetical protein